MGLLLTNLISYLHRPDIILIGYQPSNIRTWCSAVYRNPVQVYGISHINNLISGRISVGRDTEFDIQQDTKYEKGLISRQSNL